MTSFNAGLGWVLLRCSTLAAGERAVVRLRYGARVFDLLGGRNETAVGEGG